MGFRRKAARSHRNQSVLEKKEDCHDSDDASQGESTARAVSSVPAGRMLQHGASGRDSFLEREEKGETRRLDN